MEAFSQPCSSILKPLMYMLNSGVAFFLEVLPGYGQPCTVCGKKARGSLFNSSLLFFVKCLQVKYWCCLKGLLWAAVMRPLQQHCFHLSKQTSLTLVRVWFYSVLFLPQAQSFLWHLKEWKSEGGLRDLCLFCFVIFLAAKCVFILDCLTTNPGWC